MGDSLFMGRAGGEKGLYRQEADFLYAFPHILVMGAAYAADKNSEIYAWLSRNWSGEAIPTAIRKNLEYLLRVLEECRRADLADVLDPKQVDTVIYEGIMMGVGSMAFRKFNRLFREQRFTDKRTGGVFEPVESVDQAEALRLFDNTVARIQEA